ncbi:MAG: HNH endonuclease [Anaerolineae bacterium]|nr:HNH endonuclease [Anaerolineae bacterium]
MSQSITLKGGAISLVDDADHPHLSQYTWFMSQDGYAVGLVPNGDGKFKLQYMHRVILQPAPSELVDHINGDPLDNRRQNLRLATSHQNHQNRRVKGNSHTGLKGVGWHKERGQYYARIQLQGIRVHLGFFKTAEDAALAYDEAARTLFGEFAHLNYPEKQTPRSVALRVAQRLRRRGLRAE